MSPDDPNRKTDALGELLRHADPAAGTPGLPAADAREIRRRMLEEAETRRPFLGGLAGGLPRPAWAALAVLLLLAAVWFWRPGEDSPPRGPKTPIQVTETPTELRASQMPSEAPKASKPEVEPVPPETLVAQKPPAGEPSEDSISKKRTPRQVHMEAPGGTRIVWVLDPDLTL